MSNKKAKRQRKVKEAVENKIIEAYVLKKHIDVNAVFERLKEVKKCLG